MRKDNGHFSANSLKALFARFQKTGRINYLSNTSSARGIAQNLDVLYNMEICGKLYGNCY